MLGWSITLDKTHKFVDKRLDELQPFMNLAAELKVAIRRDVIDKGCCINDDVNTVEYDLVDFGEADLELDEVNFTD